MLNTRQPGLMPGLLQVLAQRGFKQAKQEDEGDDLDDLDLDDGLAF